MLFQADERTLIYGLAREDLDAVPLTANGGADRFSLELRSALGEFTEGTQAWVLGHADDWQKSTSWFPAPELHEVLSKLRGFATWLRCDRESTWYLRLECANVTAASEFNRFLDEYFAGDPDDSSWRSRIGSNLQHGVTGKTVNAQATIKTPEMRP
jgi:hypothetical protein